MKELSFSSLALSGKTIAPRALRSIRPSSPDDLAAEFADDVVVGFAVGEQGQVAELVRLDDVGAEFFELTPDERLSAGETAREADFQHRSL